MQAARITQLFMCLIDTKMYINQMRDISDIQETKLSKFALRRKKRQQC